MVKYPSQDVIIPPKLVLIGTSAGGAEALRLLLADLPPSINASIVVVRHLSPDGGQFQAEMMNRYLQMDCKVAEDGMTLQKGCVYLAPADRHLLVRGNKLVLTRGPKENRWRPSIDGLFRSAAVAARGRRSVCFSPATSAMVAMACGPSSCAAVRLLCRIRRTRLIQTCRRTL